jgi:hypothetical protein
MLDPVSPLHPCFACFAGPGLAQGFLSHPSLVLLNPVSDMDRVAPQETKHTRCNLENFFEKNIGGLPRGTSPTRLKGNWGTQKHTP